MSSLATHPAQVRARTGVLLLAAALFAACSDDGITEPPMLPAANLLEYSDPDPNFFITVYRPDGTLMRNATVTVMSQDGDAMPPRSLLTDAAGRASFRVTTGQNYCVIARVLPVLPSFPDYLPWVDPLETTIENPARDFPPDKLVGAVVTGRRGASQPFSKANYTDCYSSPSVRVNGPSTSHSMTLARGARITLNTGVYANIPAGGILASLIVPVTGLPWVDPNVVPAGLKTGFYASGDYSEVGSFVFDLPENFNFGQNGPLYIELQKKVDGSNWEAWITLTTQISAFGTVTRPIEPLYCVLNRVTDDVSVQGGGIDLAWYKHGYMAWATETSLHLLDEAWGSQLQFTGTGSLTQDIRFRQATGNISAKISATSDGTTCTASSSSPDVQVFCAQVGSTKSGVKQFYLTTIVPQTPGNTQSIESAISSPGQQIPAPTKRGQNISSAFVVTPMPTAGTCEIARSNDDKWFVF